MKIRKCWLFWNNFIEPRVAPMISAMGYSAIIAIGDVWFLKDYHIRGKQKTKALNQ